MGRSCADPSVPAAPWRLKCSPGGVSAPRTLERQGQAWQVCKVVCRWGGSKESRGFEGGGAVFVYPPEGPSRPGTKLTAGRR